MADFDFAVQHRKAERMRHVDSLSRLFSIRKVCDTILDRLRRVQREDPELKPIRVHLERVAKYENYVLLDEIIFECIERQDKFMVPSAIQTEII